MPARVAICLFNDDITSIDPLVLNVGKSLTPVAIDKTSYENCEFFLKEAVENRPDWLDVVKQFAPIKEKDVFTASSGAILFIKINNQVLACCFGSTVANINKDYIVTDFGLAAAYQRIRRGNYKTIESHTLTVNPITNNRSSAIPTTQDSFNVDNYLENITQLSGKFLSKAKNTVIKGKDFYSTISPKTFTEIRSLCEGLLEDYKKSMKDENYTRLTATRKVKDKELLEFLNKKLCEEIRKKSDKISLVDFESLSDIEYYSFTPKGAKLSDITAHEMYSTITEVKSVTVEYLKSKRIYVKSVSETDSTPWSLYRCLFFSITTNKGTFLLFKGQWYKITDKYLSDLRSFIDQFEVDASKYSLPKWNGGDEDAYNKEAAKVIKGQNWDKNFYTHASYPYGIEFCDILTTNTIMHVKKMYSSSLTSHLLYQTQVSAFLLSNDQQLKSWIISESKVLGKNLLLKNNLTFKNPNVEYAIVLLSKKKGKISNALPFFSLISFNLALRKIRELGFPVSICKV